MSKLLIVIVVLLIFSISSSSQQVSPAPQLSKQDYLQKSKSQKTGGFILLGVAATCAAIAAPGNVSLGFLPVLAIGGLASAIISIPLFISAKKNKKRAMNMALIDQRDIHSPIISLMHKPIPSLSISLSL